MRQWSDLRVSLLALVAVLLPHALVWSAEPDPATSRTLDERLELIAQEAAWLRSADKQDEAGQLESQLATWRRERAHESQLPATDNAEVHVVGVWAGTPAPEGVVKPEERFKRGYAEVAVEYAAAPVILVLATREKMHWKLNLAPGARLKAVVAAGRFLPEFSGLPAETLVYPTYQYLYGPNTLAPNSGDYHQTAMRKALAELTGSPVATWQGMPRYGGRPIVVGPANPAWREQHLLWRTGALAAQVAAGRRERALAVLGPLEFESFYYTTKHDRPEMAEYGVAWGPFTLRGPRAGQLEGVNPRLRSLPQGMGGGPRFALEDGELVNYQPQAQEMTRVPLGADLPGVFRCAALAIDTQRGRLVVSQYEPPHVLAACDLEKVRWTVLSQTKEPLAALTYDAAQDCFYGVTAAVPQMRNQGYQIVVSQADEEGNPRPQTFAANASIVRISGEGKTLETIKPSTDIRVTWDHFRGSVLHVRGDKLILSTPPVAGPWNRRLGQIVVLGRDTGEVMYHGYALPSESPTAAIELEKPPTGSGELAEAWAKLALAERSVAALVEPLGKERIAALEAELHDVREAFAGRYPDVPNAPAEVHGIGMYEPGRVTVEVGATARPVVLVLSGYEAGDWTIRLREGARLERIVTTGGKPQRVHGAPSNVPVEEAGPGPGVSMGYRRNPASFRKVAVAVRQRWNLRLATHQGVYSGRTDPWIIGTEGHPWRFLYACQRLEELLGKLPLANLPPADLDAPRFFAICETQDESEPPAMRRGRGGRRRGQQRMVAEFAPSGPIRGTMVSVTADMQRFALDPSGRRVFGIKDQKLHCLDLNTGATTPIELHDDKPFEPLAVAYDGQNRRFFLTTAGSHEHRLAVADEATGKVTRLGSTSIGIHALAYAPDRDRLFALTDVYDNDGHQPLLAELTTSGALLNMTPISGVSGFSPHSGQHQLAYREGRLIVFSNLERGAGEWKGSVCVIDPDSGQCWNFGGCRERPSKDTLSTTDLRQYWQELQQDGDEAADELAWGMAAGGSVTVDFLKQTLMPVPPLDERQIALLIEQLDSDASSAREQAFEELRAYGSRVLPALEVAAAHDSAEVRSRAEHLIEEAKSAEPRSPQLRRELRAVDVLERIDTAEARLLLAKLAFDPTVSDRGRTAKAALERLCTGNRETGGEETY